MSCLIVFPMGWKLAVPMAQHVMRRLTTKNNEIPRKLALRRDKLPPCQEDFSTKRFWQVFVDDVAKGRRRRDGEVDDSQGWLIVVKKSGQQVGFVLDDGQKTACRKRHWSFPWQPHQQYGSGGEAEAASVRGGRQRGMPCKEGGPSSHQPLWNHR